jgi:flagellar biosynthetic protein FliR
MVGIPEDISALAPVFVVVLARVAGLFLLTPLLSSGALPMRVRALVALAFAVAVFPVSGAEGLVGVRLDIVVLLPMVASEMLVGLTVGVLASIPLYSVQLAGLLMGQQMGLGIAQQVNPSADIEGDNLGQILFVVAIGTFLMLGGMDLVFAGVIESFRRVPLGSFGGEAPAVDVLVGLITSGYSLAVRVAMPVVAIIFVENLVVGYLMKTVPSMNIMNFGFPIKILVGLTTLIGAMGAIGVAIGDEIYHAMEVTEAWILELGTGREVEMGGVEAEGAVLGGGGG